MFRSFRLVARSMPQGLRFFSTEDLLARLIAAEAGRKAAEENAAREAEGRKAAEENAAREAEGRKAAEENAAREAEGRKGDQKSLFLMAMSAMSSGNAKETSGMAAHIRHGAPLPVVQDVASLLLGAPEDDGASAAVWQRYLDTRPATRKAQPQSIEERLDVHPTVKALLDLIVPAERLRIWREKIVCDDAKGAHFAPDFTLTAVRDAAPSIIAALLTFEVKRPGQIQNAVHQACTYMRRRIFKLCLEADQRGAAMDGIETFGVALDGRSIVLLRMRSGAPGDGGSFKTAQPCPVVCTPTLPLLLEDWQLLERGQQQSMQQQEQPQQQSEALVPSNPLAGLAALRRLLAAPSSMLGESACPLQSLRVSLQGAEAAGVEARSVEQWWAGGQQQLLQLGDRLGCGGSSDVYQWQHPQPTSASAAAEANGVVKVARCGTEQVMRAYEAERRSLSSIALRGGSEEGLVPRCLSFGVRTATAAADFPTSEREQVAQFYPWPLLVLHPTGVPLEQWVEQQLEGVGEPAAAAAAVRMACADAVLPRLLRALAAGHSAGWVHSDVRPANVIVTPRGAMLVDWGAACSMAKKEAVWCCVPAFSSKVMLRSEMPRAQPALDGVGALCTWLAVAYGPGCTAPWLERPHESEALLLDARLEWVQDRARTEPRVARAEKVLLELEEALVAGKRLQSSAVLAAVAEALRSGPLCSS